MDSSFEVLEKDGAKASS